MGKYVYTSFEYAAYVLQGVVLLFVLDILFDLPQGVVQKLVLTKIDGMEAFLAFAAAFALGQVNSSIAHLLFQEFLTAISVGRPSKHLLEGRDDHWLSYCRSFSAETKQCIKDKAERLRVHQTRMQSKSEDRRIFSAAFSWAHKDPNFSGRRESLLTAFNFSRNMSCCLLIAVILLSAKSTCNVFLNGGMGDELFLCWLKVALVIAAGLLFVRYLYFLRVLTKQVLLNFLEQPEPVETTRLVTP